MAGDAVSVFLVRHGAHDLLGRKVAGRMASVSLNAEGRAEAGRVAARLSGEDVAALHAGPLERAAQTAAPIAAALGLPVQTSEALDEVDYGDWTGVDLQGLDDDPRWRTWNMERASARIPGGETMAQVADRMGGLVEGWRRRHPGRAVVAVSHGDVIRAFVCRLLQLSFDRIHAFDVSPGSLSTAVVWDGGGKVVALNERPR